MSSTIHVNLPGRAYAITVAAGLLERLGDHVRTVAPHERALLAVDSSITETHAPVARRALADAGYEVTVEVVEAREGSKTMQRVTRLYDAMLGDRLERSSPIIALGGGIVGDLAGFAAATFHRGVPLVQVPTTLLAMVDASIGGKTGVNYPIPGRPQPGKNLIGSFWQPRAVLADPHVLRTLDDRQLRCGLAECVKHAVIADPDLLELIAQRRAAIFARDPGALEELVARSAAVKAAIVEQDEHESGVRAALNLGHTFGHAIEPIEDLGLHHGEAVAIGLCAALRCAEGGGRLSSADAQRIIALLEDLGLPTRLPAPVPAAELVAAMRYDKKVAGGRIRLVLPTAIGAVELEEQPEALIEEAWRSVGAA